VIRRLAPQLAKTQGIALYLQAAQDITIGGRVSKTLYQYTLTDAIRPSSTIGRQSTSISSKLFRNDDVATDQESGGPMLNVTVNREAASTYGSCFDDRQHARRCFRPAYRLHHVHGAQSISRDSRGGPEVPVRSEALSGIYVNSSAGQQVRSAPW